MHFRSLLFVFCFFFLGVLPAKASLILTEIFADPAAGLLGDANGDGVASSTQDEFLEFFNDSMMSADISGWFISDAVQMRHVFPFGTILNPYDYIVIFGGGNFQSTVLKQKASTGILSLNNTGDTVSLYDSSGVEVFSLVYGSLASRDQSIVRYPDDAGAFQLHSSVDYYGGKIYSPGYGSYEGVSPVMTPEPISLITAGLGLPFLVFRRRKLQAVLTE